MPIFVEGSITQLLSVPFWIGLFLILFHKRLLKNIYPAKIPILIFICFIVYYYTVGAVIPAYYRSALPYPIEISIFVLICGSACSSELNDEDLDMIITFYIISTLIVGFSIYISYIAGASFGSRQYLYDSKNSVCQILLTGFIFALFTKQNRTVIAKLTNLLILLFLAYEILMLQSRASIIGIPLALLLVVINRNINKWTKRVVLFSLIACIIYLLIPENLEFFKSNILFAGRNAANLNDLSSGRSNEWENFPVYFHQHPWIGVGRFKMESLILTSLLEYGLIGGSLILILALTPLIYALKNYKFEKHKPVFLAFLAISICYVLNGVFEQLAPFGPGVKCYALWFLFGILKFKSETNENNITE